MRLPIEYFFVLIFPIVLVLPLPLVASSISLTLCLLNILIIAGIDWNKKKLHFRFEWDSLILFIVFVILVDSLTTVGRDSGFKFVFRDVRISLLIVPIIFSLIKSKWSRLKKHIMFSLVTGVILYIMFCYGYLTYFYSFLIKNRSFEFSHFLLYDLRENVPGVYHHSYIGLYMTTSLAVLIYYRRLFKSGFFFHCIVLFIFLNQVIIGSKLSIIMSMTLILWEGIRLLKINLKYKYWQICFGAIIVLLLVTVAQKLQVGSSFNFSVGNRLESWKCSMQGFFNNPVGGLGHEASVEFLNDCIQSLAVSTHNQYLEELINYGVLGLWLPVFYAIVFLKSKGDFLFRIFIIVVILQSCFENILSLQRGVLFFTFFCSILFFDCKNQNSYKDNDIETDIST